MRQDNIILPEVPDRDRPGDAWMQGPDGDVRTWNGRRRWVFMWGAILTLVITCVTLVLVPRSVIFKPGELSSPHAQILSGTLAQQRCAACHGETALSPVDWFLSATGNAAVAGHSGASQSERCMDCHHQTIPVNLALTAHNLPSGVREKMTELIRREGAPYATSIDQNNVQCSVCHKEHRGRDGDLLSMSDAQCQACHSRQFQSFADSHATPSHPDWGQWPYEHAGAIAFNHATHQVNHFPKSSAVAGGFQCSVCHPDASGSPLGALALKGELMRSASYEMSCRACHDEPLNLQSSQGLELIALPMLPQAAVAGNQNWPQSAIGYPDGVIAPLMELLLRSDPDVAAQLRQIDQGDLGRLDPDRDRETLAMIAAETEKLMGELASEGHDAMRKRLSDAGIATDRAGELFRTLPPQFIRSTYRQWFNPAASQQVSLQPPSTSRRGVIRTVALTDELNDDDLLDDSLLDDSLLQDPLGSDALGSDALVDDPLAIESNLQPTGSPESKSLEPAVRNVDLVSLGGWYRDDDRMAIRYRGYGHIDPVMVALVQTFNQLSEVDGLKSRFFSLPAVSACMECHPGAKSVPSQWRASARIGRRDHLTKFSHGPHLNVSNLGSCVHCHQIDTAAVQTQDAPDFCRMPKETCVACHRPGAAGDHCTQCHRYHVGRR